jgi:hypothetical protein
MADSSAFEAACACLEQSSSLDRLAARGTIRLALKEAGLEAKTVTARQLEVVVNKVLPAELAARDVATPDAVCARIATALRGLDGAGAVGADTPEAVFARLAGR